MARRLRSVRSPLYSSTGRFVRFVPLAVMFLPLCRQLQRVDRLGCSSEARSRWQPWQQPASARWARCYPSAWMTRRRNRMRTQKEPISRLFALSLVGRSTGGAPGTQEGGIAQLVCAPVAGEMRASSPTTLAQASVDAAADWEGPSLSTAVALEYDFVGGSSSASSLVSMNSSDSAATVRRPQHWPALDMWVACVRWTSRRARRRRKPPPVAAAAQAAQIPPKGTPPRRAALTRLSVCWRAPPLSSGPPRLQRPRRAWYRPPARARFAAVEWSSCPEYNHW